MKYCPICRSTYTDKTLSFCLQDGAKLVSYTKEASQMETVALQSDEVESKKQTIPFSVKATEKNKFEKATQGSKISSSDEEKLEEENNGFFGKLLSYLLLVIISGVLGAGAYYFWMQSDKPVETPQITQMQSPDTPLLVFENLRRTVDKEPNKYIAANASAPRNAEDFYLLGRAYLLTGRFVEAKKALDEAKNHLVEVGAINSRVLANDIETSLIVANNPYAQEEFKKKLNLTKTDSTVPTNSSVNLPSANRSNPGGAR